MFNGAKGRFYSFTDGNLLNEFVDIDSTTAFQPKSEYQKSQQIDIDFDSQSRPITVQKLKVIAANLGK